MVESWLPLHLLKSEMLAGSTAATCSWQDAVMREATSNEGSSDDADWEAAMNAELQSSIRRRAGDGDVNLADVWPTITRVDAEPEAGRALARAGSTARRHAGSTAWWRAGSTTWTSAGSPADARPSYRTCTRSPLRRRGVTVPSLIETICEL